MAIETLPKKRHKIKAYGVSFKEKQEILLNFLEFATAFLCF